MSGQATDTILQEFQRLLEDRIEVLEQDVLALERDHDPAVRRSLMGNFHNLKGEAALLDLPALVAVAHAAETFLEETGRPAAETLLRVVDWLRHAKVCLTEGRPLPDAGGLLKELQPMEGSGTGNVVSPDTAAAFPPVSALETVDLADVDAGEVIDFCDEAEEHLAVAEEQLLVLDGEPTAREALDAVFRAFHTIKGVAGFTGLTPVQETAHRAEELLSAARRGALELRGEALDLAFRSVDVLKEMIRAAREAVRGDGRLVPSPAATELLSRLAACLSQGDGDSAAPAAPPPAEPAVEADRPAPANSAAAPGGGGLVLLDKGKRKLAAARRDTRRKQTAAVPPAREVMRVDAERLDRLVNLIGELVIAEAMLKRAADRREDDPIALYRHLDRVGKISRDLQEIGLSLRMVPVKSLFQKMARLVRDLSRKCGRDIVLETCGEETEVDKGVVDLLADPLVHLLRNAVDHGIEKDPAERVRAGKPAQAVIALRAYHKGGNLVVEVEDDGRGLDRERILARAVERGLVREGEQLSDREIDELIFRPGFSTAEKITEVSGRGVGMDVVRRNIESLRGSVEVDSEPGQGTLFRLRLPLTLSIIEGLLVRAGGEVFVLPSLAVERLVRPAPGTIQQVLAEGRLLPVGDRLLPVHPLADLLGMTADVAASPVAVVVTTESGPRALLVDEVQGRQQIVIKNLGAGLPEIPGVGGAAILPDGRVALILDVGGLDRGAAAAVD